MRYNGATIGANYHLKPGYVERLEPEYWLDEATEVLWQPDVYLEAAALAGRLGALRIVDVGCGYGEKIGPYRDEFEIVGIDFGSNIAACRERYDWGTWLDADLDADDAPLPVADPGDSVVVCADVVEHVLRPERLLRKLRDLLDRGALALVLTTPERDLRRGRSHSGPSPNRAPVREWALDELRAFMRDEGLEGFFGLTRTNDRSPDLHTIFAVVPSPRLAERRRAFDSWLGYRLRWQELVLEQEASNRRFRSQFWVRAGTWAQSRLGRLRGRRG